MRNNRFIPVFFLLIILLVNSCKKDEVPANPYDSIDRSQTTTPIVDPDPNSIIGLHKNIFFPKCANPGCHDGTFEPDYRTVQSTFSTLVYQPVNKTTLDSVKIFSQRVIPHNTDDSWLIERLTTSTSEYMPSNGVRLSTAEIDHVRNWINAGCPDNNGNLPVKPNLQPNIIGYVAVDSAFNRRDSIRLGNVPVNPFVVQQGETITFAILATDTADGADATDPADFTSVKIYFSTDKNDFTSATVVSNAVYLSIYTAWLINVPITWPANTTVYFRVHVNDGHHTADSEFPRFESLDYYKTIYGIHVQ